MKFALALAVAGLSALAARGDDKKAEGKKLEFTAYDDYAVADGAGKDGKALFRAFTDRAAFGKAFVVYRLGGGPARERVEVPEKAFDDRLVATAVTRGEALVGYAVEGVTLDQDGTATVRYATKTSDKGGATYACPLVVTLPKDGVKKIVFVADGKEAGTAEVT